MTAALAYRALQQFKSSDLDELKRARRIRQVAFQSTEFEASERGLASPLHLSERPDGSIVPETGGLRCRQITGLAGLNPAPYWFRPAREFASVGLGAEEVGCPVENVCQRLHAADSGIGAAVQR